MGDFLWKRSNCAKENEKKGYGQIAESVDTCRYIFREMG